MKTFEIVNSMTRTFNKVGFQLKKHSPEILAAAGAVGVVASGVMACKATTKLSGILEDSKNSLDAVHGYVDAEGYSEKYTEEDSKKDLAIIYTQTGVKLIKLYAPAVIIGTLSITAMLASNNILRKRNIALAAAYTTIDKGFKEYRGRVIERFGKELDHELKYNVKAEEVTKTVTNEDGTESEVKSTVEIADPNEYSTYARFFDDGCPGWHKDPEYNLTYLRKQQDYANELLKAKGHLYLNEVYDILGLPRSKAGQIVGWVYDEKQPVGDNFVDFGIYDMNKRSNRDFVNGYERTILLDFNVDGNILDLM